MIKIKYIPELKTFIIKVFVRIKRRYLPLYIHLKLLIVDVLFFPIREKDNNVKNKNREQNNKS